MNANVSTEAEMLYLNRQFAYKQKYILVTFLIVVMSQLGMHQLISQISEIGLSATFLQHWQSVF